MRSPWCLCVPPQRLKAGKVEPKETAFARQRLGKHFPAATNTLLDVVFSKRSVSYEILNIL
jgi:hypothetical protein